MAHITEYCGNLVAQDVTLNFQSNLTSQSNLPITLNCRSVYLRTPTERTGSLKRVEATHLHVTCGSYSFPSQPQVPGCGWVNEDPDANESIGLEHKHWFSSLATDGGD